MLKRFIFFVITFSLITIVLNFSFVSISMSGADKIRLLSLAIIISILQIAGIFGATFSFFKSAKVSSRKEVLNSFALNNIDDGIIVYNSSHLVLFINSKAEEFLGIKYAEISDTPLKPDLSLRNPKLSKLIGAVFYSKPDPEYDRFFIKESEMTIGKEKIFVKILKPKGLTQFHQ